MTMDLLGMVDGGIRITVIVNDQTRNAEVGDKACRGIVFGVLIQNALERIPYRQFGAPGESKGATVKIKEFLYLAWRTGDDKPFSGCGTGAMKSV